MTRELERFDWARLRAQGSAERVPGALEALASASSDAEARDAYWKIDNTVVVQGALYEAAVATAACTTVVLHRCHPPARARALELLVQLGSGDTAPSEHEVGDSDIRERCLAELLSGFSLYVHLLEDGTRAEKGHCVDLLGLCCSADQSLCARVTWHLKKLLEVGVDDAVAQLTRGWLEQLA